MLQRSGDWLKARCGMATASRFADVLATIKTGEAASRRNYRAQLVVERMTGVPQESYQNEAMRYGTEMEPFARIAYEAASGNIVTEVGLIRHPEILAGASPDGLVEADGLVEIKVPNTATHIDTLLNGMDPGHLPQIQGQMWITGRKWCDFVSYDPRMPEQHRFYCERVKRDDKYIQNLETEVIKFLNEVSSTIERLEARLRRAA